MTEEELKHFGILGMKWGVTRKIDEINRSSRTIKKGTVIQNISSRPYEQLKRHLYGAYTDSDKATYIDMMGNTIYEGKSYKNEFVVKKNIKIPSDNQLVDAFVKMAKKNPAQVSSDMHAAYTEQYGVSLRSKEYFSKQISKIDQAKIKTGEKLAAKYITTMMSDKTKKSRAMFIGSLVRRGFEAMSDINDRDNVTKDPLIIFNPSKTLGKSKSVELSERELNYYLEYANSKKFRKKENDVSDIQR